MSGPSRTCPGDLPGVRGIWAVVVIALASALAGCRAATPSVTFTSLDRSHTLKQRFNVAAMSRDAFGDYDLVLVSQGDVAGSSWWRRTAKTLNDTVNPVSWFRREPEAAPLTPTADAPVRQVLHFKIHWRPRAGTSPENPAASNATVRWLVEGPQDPVDPQPDLLEYQGTAFVRIRFGRDGYRLAFREGQLRATRVDGDMMDVLGPNRFTGSATVRDDPFTVGQVLSGLPPPSELPAPAEAQRIRPATRPATAPAGGRR
ncbi:MAG: hypothetical protein ACK4PI_07190 [Tepidisphaerales bacterium]